MDGSALRGLPVGHGSRAYPGSALCDVADPVSGERPDSRDTRDGPPVTWSARTVRTTPPNYVSAASSNGAITYVETAYAIQHGNPVASIINQSGNAVQPTSLNDATALEKAILYKDLTQNLTGVYTNPLPNAYPVSSYSYLVTPCSPSLARRRRRRPAVDPAGLRLSPLPRARRSANSSPFWRVPANRRWLSSVIRLCHRTWSRRTSTPSAG